MSYSEIFANNIFDYSIVMIYIFIIIYLSRKFIHLGWKFHYLALAVGFLHLIMSVLYNYYSLSTPSDSKGYFFNSLQNGIWESFNFGDGTTFISLVIYPFTNFLGISYLGSNLIFSLISLLGIYKLYQVAIGLLNRWSFWFLLFLLPSLHFWTGFLGKDALLFFGISSLIFNAFFNKKLAYYITPLFLILFARFYIFAFIAVGFLLTLVFLSNKIKFFLKIVIGGAGMVSIIYLTPFFFNVVGIKETDKLSEKRDVILQANMEGGSGIDLGDSNIVVRFFSYLFRPFIHEAHSFTSLMAAVENIVWIIIFFIIVKNFTIIMRSQNNLFWFCFTSFFTLVLPAAYILSNLGIAARQKIMVLPFLLYVFFMVLKRKQEFLR